MRKKIISIAVLSVIIAALGILIGVLQLTGREDIDGQDGGIEIATAENAAYITVYPVGGEEFKIDANASSVVGYDEVFKFDTDKISQLRSSLTPLNAEAVVEEHYDDLSIYGIDDASARITIEDYNGGKTDILIGKEAAFNKGYYAYLQNKDTMYIISYSSAEGLSNDLLYFRDPNLIEEYYIYSSGYNINSISFSREGMNDLSLSFKTAETEDGTTETEVFGGNGEKLDAGKVYDNFMQPFSEITYSASVIEDSPKDISKFGLNDPEIVISVTSDEEYSYKILVSHEHDGIRYAMRNDIPSVSEVASDFFDFAFIDESGLKSAD